VGTPVLFIHGLWLHATSWDAWLEKVVWWRNRAGQYYLKSGIPTAVVRARNSEAAVPEDERRPVALPTPLPAGHYY